MPWTPAQIPDLSGKTALVTGANSGLGLQTAIAFAGKGAKVVLACRGKERAEAAMQQILALHPKAQLEFLPLNLASLASVRAAAEAFKQAHSQLHILCNNAGLMGLPFSHTEDGFEMLFGTNHLGHFALTGLLLPTLTATPGARVISLASVAAKQGDLQLDDLLWQRRSYRKFTAYGSSKLANLLFALELQRRLQAAGLNVLSLAAHPGYAATGIALGGAEAPPSAFRKIWAGMVQLGNALIAQPADKGALPTLFAATAAEAKGGDYIGPDGLFEFRGNPKHIRPCAMARDARLAADLWAHSEQATGVRMLSA